MKNPFLKITQFTFVMATIGILQVACEKDRIEEDEPKEETAKEYANVNEYFNQKKQEEQEFEITNEDGPDPIEGKEGTRIWISKNCLEFPNGDTVALPYTVKLIELYPAKEMIYYQMPTVAGGNILETGGEVRLRAFKDGTELRLKNGCYSEVEMPNSNPKGYMNVYYGFSATVPGTTDFTDWTTDLAGLGVSTPANPNFDSTAYGYKTALARLGWVNCDIARNSGSGHTLTFKSTTDNLTNVAIYVYFKDLWGLMQVYNQSSGLIPTGSDVKVICIGVDGSGATFVYEQDLTVNANTDVTVTMTAISDADLTAILDGL